MSLENDSRWESSYNWKVATETTRQPQIVEIDEKLTD